MSSPTNTADRDAMGADRALDARVVRTSLGAPSAEVLETRLGRLVDAGCRAELRLDLLPADADLARLVREFPTLDFLAAWPALADAPPPTRRIEALRQAAEAGVPWLDVPLELVEASLPATRRVVSWHAPPDAAPDAVAAAIDAALASCGDEDLAKIVGRAEYAEQAFEVMRCADAAPGRVIAFAMGAGGVASRMFALRHGAPWTYAGWRGEATADGQLEWREMLRMLPESTAGPLGGVVGDPVAQSWSPLLWRTAWGSRGWFAPFRVRDFPDFLARAADYGLEALAVTAPCKQAARAAADELDAAAELCDAANLLLWRDGAWRAANTDGIGALDALEEAGLAAGASLLVLGAGGAARAAAAEALGRGHAVTLAARRGEAAQQAAAQLGGIGTLGSSHPAADCAIRATTLPAELDASDAVIHATPVGSVAQPGDLTAGQRFRSGALALDMVYAPPDTAFLRHAARDGATPVRGSAMLLHQMRVQFALHGGTAPPLAPLAAALDAAIARRAGVVLLGPRGSGKSTLGRWLAEVLGAEFVDADAEYAARHGVAVADALSEDETAFRTREAALLGTLLDEIADRGGAVLAAGGGAVVHADSRARLATHPGTVLLQAAPEVLAARQLASPRPELRGGGLLAESATLLAERAPHYAACARVTVATDGSENESRAALLAAIVGLDIG